MPRAIFLFTAVAALTLHAQPDLAGAWHGETSSGSFRLQMRVTRAAGAWQAIIDAPDFGIANLPVPSITQSGDTIHLDLPGFGASFSGSLSADAIAGHFTRQDVTVPFIFYRGTLAPQPPAVKVDLTPYQAVIADPRRWMEDDGVQVPIPPREHPRLYLRARDLPDLHRRVAHPVLQPIWTDMQKRARRNPQIALEVDALRYLLTQDADLGRRTAASAVTMLEQAAFDKHIEDISRAIGRMMVTGAIVYDWCYSVLTPEQKQRLIAQEIRLAKEMETGYPPYDGSYLTGHGSEWMIMRDLLSAGVAIYDEDPAMYRYAANRFFKGHLPARNFWYQGHAFHQGSAYAETRTSSELYPLWIFDRMGFPNIYNPSLEFVPYSWIYMRRPDGQLLRSGDGQSRAPKLRSLLNASYYHDGYVLADYLRDPGVGDLNEIFELLWRDPDLEPRPVTDLPLSRYMGEPFGWMVARTGWDADSVIAEMKINIYNFGNHEHLDAGAFQIYYKGPLAIDSGLYEGANGAYGSPHHLNYYQRTIAHNSLLIYDPSEKFPSSRRADIVNDGGQSRPNNGREASRLEDLLTRGYRTGAVFGHDIGASYTYLKGDITAAYSAKVREVKRSFVFLNLDEKKAALIVFDKVTAADPSFRKFWLLHSMEEPEVRGNATVISLSQRGWTGRLFQTALLPEPANAEIVKVGGPGHEFEVFGQNFPNQPGAKSDPKEFEIGAWRIELKPRRPAATDYFLNVLQVADDRPVERISAPELTGVQIADRVIWFQKESARLDHGFQFRTTGAGQLHYLLTDLAPGTWQIWRDGAIVIPATPVSADAGTLFFSGPGGAYEIRR